MTTPPRVAYEARTPGAARVGDGDAPHRKASMTEHGTVRGTHHLTFCVGAAQEDYDFHVRLLGLRSVKKTVLFDGEIPVYHLYYANSRGDAGTVLTSFPYRQAGWMGRRGSNQTRRLNLAVPTGALGFWADRLGGHGVEHAEVERFGTQRLHFQHPSGVEYALVGFDEERRADPWEVHGVPGEHAILSAFGTTTSVHQPDGHAHYLEAGLGARRGASEGAHHQFLLGEDAGHGQHLEVVEEPDVPQGTWHFGEGTVHHHAFDVGDAESQAAIKDRIVGLGYTDASEPKDRGYFTSVYSRTPGGALVELAYSKPEGWTIDEAPDELGTHMCIPPHWEDRRAELDVLEDIDTDERMVAGA